MKDKVFVDEINSVIKCVIEEYAALSYTQEQLPFVPKCDIQFTSDQLFLDVNENKIKDNFVCYNEKTCEWKKGK